MMQDQGLIGALENARLDIRRFLIARTGSEADADDLLSDLWIKVRAGQSGPVANPRSYLYRMANNLVLDRLRATRRRQRREAEWTAERHGELGRSVEVVEPAPTAEEMLINAEQARRLAEAIAQLPPGAQRVLRRHKLDGLSHGEIADELGISRSAVEKHMAVAMVHLRRLMGD